MTENQKIDQGIPEAHPVFVIGTGRSGTHWLGYSLGDHPEVHATVEERKNWPEIDEYPLSKARPYDL